MESDSSLIFIVTGFFRGRIAAERGRHVKKLVLGCAILLAIMAGSVILTAAQEPPSTEYTTVYMVKSGDTLWGLTGSQWQAVVEKNSWLESRVERKSADLVIVRIYPGESILVPRGFGLEEDLRLDPPAPATITYAPIDPSELGGFTSHAGVPLWWLWLLAGAIVLAVAYFGRRALLDPATAGPAIVPGGIPPGDTRAIENHFTQVAERRYGQIDPTANLAVARPVRVGPIEEGFLSGLLGRVLYQDGTSRLLSLRREPAYRAQFRFPNGTEETLYFLQRCGNDVYAGTQYLGFTFEPRVGATPIPTPAPPTEEPARRQTAIHLVDPNQPETRPTRIVVGTYELEIPPGGVIEIDPKGNCVVTIGGVTFAIKANRPARPRRTKPAATASTQ